MRDPLYDVVPGFREALEKESRIREYAFLDLPELIGNVKVKPFTPRHFALLELSRSPFLVGGDPTVEDVLFFIWVVSDEFEYDNADKRKMLVEKIIKENNVNDLYQQCIDYLNDSFYDNLSKTSDSVEKTPFFSFVASIVDLIASEYHWSQKEILDTPFKRLNQYMKAIVLRNNPTVTLFNPSDKLKSEWLANLMRPQTEQ